LISKNQNKILDIINNKSNCLSEEKLTSLINKKNKLVKQLNNTLKVIDINTKSLGATTELITLLNNAILTQEITLSTIPTSTGVVGVPGVSIGTITAADSLKNDSKALTEKLTRINIGITSTLFLLKQTLTQATQLLQLLDQLVQKCYPDTEQEQISIELTNLTTQQSLQQSPVVINVNGFKMGVETEITDKPLKRRRATATDKQNVVMLRGEWSFSSIDQILIDELVFYIEQNNLKAD
jgi:alanine-alpha-ketoisovalerate/valine-pyruvate aminotransferase